MKIQLRQPKSHSLTLGFIGDTAPGFPKYTPLKKSSQLIRLLNSCNLVIANLESPLTTASSCKGWGSSLSSDPTSIKEIKDLNVKIANLANNHIMDRGLLGLEQTQRVLTHNEIIYLGAGKDLKHAGQPVVYEINTSKIAFLAFSFENACFASIATAKKPGANPLILNEAKAQIKSLRDRGYTICVSYHGGDEFFRVPNPKYRRVLRELALAGAHIVIGHHSHIFQGIEMYNGSIIAYGLGNFYMNTKFQKAHRGTDVGLILLIELDRLGPVSYSIHFVHTQRKPSNLSIVEGQNKNQLLNLIKQLSSAMTDQNQYISEWRRDCFRLILGLNAQRNDPLYLKTACISYGLRGLISYEITILRQRRKEKILLNHPIILNSSILEIYSAALLGFPTTKSDLQNLKQCYMAYQM